VAHQGFPPGRHSREPAAGPQGGYDRAPYPDEPPYGGEAPYREEAPYVDEARARDHVPGHARSPRPGPGSRPDRAVRPDRSRRPDRQRPERAGWQQIDPFGSGPDTDSDLPPWAGPSAYPVRASATLRRPVSARPHDAEDDLAPGDGVDAEPGQAPDTADAGGRYRRRRGRAAATRLRKSRRRVYRACATAIVACVVAAGIALIVTHHSPKPALYVTSLQPGEFESVPNACDSVGAALLDQFLPTAGRTTTSELASSTDSQCSFTVDAKPSFLVLEVQAQSYQPFAAAAGDGSASGNAQDNFALAEQGLAHPLKNSPLPPAQISKLTGLGQQALMAFQNERVSGIVTDVITVVIRERNAVITASMSGQESGHGFGPVPVSTLQAGARAAAKAMLAKVMTQPTA
jgi:hypothetical protein